MAVTVGLLFLICMFTCCNSDLPLLDFDEFPFKDEDRVCFDTRSTLQEFYREFGGHVKNGGITVKPAKVPKDSPCYGMPTTCCLSNEEKRMQPFVELAYHKELQAVLERRLGSCSKLGRSTERVIYLSLKQARQMLEAEVSTAIGIEELPLEVFDDFFKFLYRFVHVLDFCQLSNEVKLQMTNLYDYVITDSSSFIHNGNCSAEEYKEHFIDTWYKTTLNSIVESLNVARLISETYQLTEKLLKDLKQHKFSQQCIDSLFRLKPCSYCTGNHIHITVCDGLCLNTFRGCMADMYSIIPYFESLKDQLHQNIIQLANTELMPVKLVQSSMIGFVHLVKHVKHFINNPESLKLSEANCSSITSDGSVISQIESERSIKHHQKQPHQEAVSFKEAIKSDLVCYEDVLSVLSELDEEICQVNPKHIKYIRNKSCWNSTHLKGSYEESLVGKSKQDQLTNPTIHRLPYDTFPYDKQISQVHGLIRDINKTKQFYECIETDDEDCHLFVLECKKDIPHSEILEPGSGSGSGSGHGVYHSTDGESSSTVLIQLGGPRRYADFMTDRNGTDQDATIAETAGNANRYTANNNSSTSSTVIENLITSSPTTSSTGYTSSTSITSITSTTSITSSDYSRPSSSIPTKSSAPKLGKSSSSAAAVSQVSSVTVVSLLIVSTMCLINLVI